MDQKTKPWAFPKPHPENTPRGERNKQEFDAPAQDSKSAPKPRGKKEIPARQPGSPMNQAGRRNPIPQ